MGFFSSLAVSAVPLRGIAFFRYGIPLITLAGLIIALVYGWKGVIRRTTLLFLPASAFGNATGAIFLPVTGAMAVVLGLLYWVIALLFLLVLLPFSLGLLGILEPTPAN